MPQCSATTNEHRRCLNQARQNSVLCGIHANKFYEYTPYFGEGRLPTLFRRKTNLN